MISVYAELIDGLNQRSPVVLITSLGGMGKTTLAREVAYHCLTGENDMPQFDAVVWASDKDRPGTTTLSIVLDKVAHTLDYSGFTQFAYDEKQREVEQLLRRQRVLLVVDNFETITDGSLLSWLIRLPEPSKAIVTSREFRRDFRSSWPLELKGMSEEEAHEFIRQRLRILKIEKLIIDPAHLEPLIIATGGNPKAIEIALGCIKYQRQPLQHVIDDLYAARGEIFEDLFLRTWNLLEDSARRILLAMPLFPSSASGAAIAHTADVHGFAFDRAIEWLTDLALLDIRQSDINVPPRYALHPLVRAFANAKLSEHSEYEMLVRGRWVGWYLQLVSEVGYCWDNLSKLTVLDPEQETTFAVLQWTFQNHRYVETIKMARGIEYYYYVRGFWDKNPSTNLLRAKAAHNLVDAVEEVEAIAYHVQVLSKQGNTMDVERHLQRLQDLARTIQLPKEVLFEYQHALALSLMARQDFDAAQEMWQNMMDLAEQLSIRAYIANRRWLATCLYHKGRLALAKDLLQTTLRDALEHSYTRGIVSIQIRLANIALDLGDQEGAAIALHDAQSFPYQERRHTAEIQRSYARLHIHRNDTLAARAALAEAIDLFERLGMRRELVESRTELARV